MVNIDSLLVKEILPKNNEVNIGSKENQIFSIYTNNIISSNNLIEVNLGVDNSNGHIYISNGTTNKVGMEYSAENDIGRIYVQDEPINDIDVPNLGFIKNNFAKSGYGYGEQLTFMTFSDDDGTELEEFIDNNLFYAGDGFTYRFSKFVDYPALTMLGNGGWADVNVFGDGKIKIVAYDYNDDNSGFYTKMKKNGTWGEWKHEGYVQSLASLGGMPLYTIWADSEEGATIEVVKRYWANFPNHTILNLNIRAGHYPYSACFIGSKYDDNYGCGIYMHYGHDSEGHYGTIIKYGLYNGGWGAREL